MAKLPQLEKTSRRRLSRKTKKALIASIGREQYHTEMSAQAHDSTKRAKADIFSRYADQPYEIRSGRLQRLKSYSNIMSKQ